MSEIGKVYLVGAGCGDYDLITLRGKKLLKKCDTVIYDSLIDTRLLDFVPENAEKICVGKRAGRHSETQENINRLIVEKSAMGKTVVRLKGGDPFVFGRGGEEILALKEKDIPYSVVPGISSSIAVAELGGIPVTHRMVSRSFHVITGHTAEDLLPENMKAYAVLNGTLVFLMGLGNLKKIAESLIANGKNPHTPAAVISNGATVRQKIVRGTLGSIADIAEKEKISSPAVTVVGDTAEFDFSPTILQPLKNIKVTVTGTKRLTDKLSDKLWELGADTEILGYLKVKEYTENPSFDNALENIERYGAAVLTSMNGAQIFLSRLKKKKIDLRRLSNLKFAVIGSGTAGILEQSGIFADIIPETFTAKCLGETLAEKISKDEKILILRAQKGSAELTKILSEKGLSFDEIKTYDVCGNTSCGREITSDFITFASSSGVYEFFKCGYKISSGTKVVSIGEMTGKTLAENGVKDFIVCKTQNTDGIVGAILTEAEK